MRFVSLALLMLLVLARPAEAGSFGYDYAQFSGGMGGPQGYLKPPTPFTEFLYDDVGIRADMRGHIFTWNDDSGFLTAALTGGTFSDRSERYKEAVERGNSIF